MDRQEEMESVEPRRRDKGFTLIELLIVIVILGILSAVVVLSVSAITSRGESSACSADQKSLRTAFEAALANGSGALTEAQLATQGYLNAESTYWNYTSAGTPPKQTFTAQDSKCGTVPTS